MKELKLSTMSFLLDHTRASERLPRQAALGLEVTDDGDRLLALSVVIDGLPPLTIFLTEYDAARVAKSLNNFSLGEMP